MNIEWQKDGYNCWTTKVPVVAFKGAPQGEYEVIIQPRPHYCDRGDWIIFVEARGEHCLDGADGFPRYFFGTDEDVKRQMETWINKRKECEAVS